MNVLFSSSFTKAIVVVLIALKSAISSNDKQTPYVPKTYDKMVCNLVQDSHISEAITKLEAKMETLIALVNKTYTPEPKLAGKLRQSLFNLFSTSCQ